MENPEKIQNLQSLYTDVSKKLSDELLKRVPNTILLTTCRKQLSQLDKDIRRIQLRRDWI
jgi:hypothetical protein